MGQSGNYMGTPGRPASNGARRSSERSAWRGTPWPTVSVHSPMMALHLGEFSLLIWCKRLEQRSFSLGVRRRHLCRQRANGVGSLLDACGVILLDGGLQALMGRLHLVMHGPGIIRDLTEDRSRLLLLRRRER